MVAHAMPETILTIPQPPSHRRVRYGDAPQHFAEVRFPSGSALAPAVINIHGGFWRNKYDLAHAGHFCAALTRAGFVTVNVEYRRVGDPGGGWPGTLDDLRRAFAHVVEHAGELRIDPRRIIVSGHSAGAQLALCLAAHESQIARVVSLAGVLDLRRAWELHLSNDAVAEFLAGSPQQVPQHYAGASPIELAVSADQVVVHGTNDDDVPVRFSRDYVTTKNNRGERVRLVEIPNADHFDLIDPASAAWDEVKNCFTSDF
jgi:acetyl esterase/lipase